MVGGQVEGKKAPGVDIPGCGVVGQPCATDLGYPVCDPVNPEDGWVGLVQLSMQDDAEKKTSQLVPTVMGAGIDPTKLRNLISGDAATVLTNGQASKLGLAGLCRSLPPNSATKMVFYGYEQRGGLPAWIALFNVDQSQEASPYRDIGGFPMNPLEMFGLASCPEMGLRQTDVKLRAAPQLVAEKTYGNADYLFTNNPDRLDWFINILNNPNVKIPNLSDVRRVELRKHLEKIKKDSPVIVQRANVEYLDWSKIWPILIPTISGALLTLGGTLPMLYFFNKNTKQQQRSIEMQAEILGQQKDALDLQRKMMTGDNDQNKLEKFSRNLVDEQREKLAEDVIKNEIRGRDSEALELLTRLARPRAANPLLLGDSGVGKDKVAERAAQLIVLRDPRVPKQFLNGTIKGIIIIDPNAFSATRGVVGDSAGRVKEIVRAMKEGFAIYFPELSDFFSSGAHSGGVSEALGPQLKDPLTREGSRFAGSTTPASYEALVKGTPWLRDMFRRLPPLVVKSMPAGVLRMIANSSTVPFLEDYYHVSITPEAREASVNLALKYLPDGSNARFDAIEQLLLDTVERVAQERASIDNGNTTITKDDVVRVLSERVGQPVDGNATFVDTLPDHPDTGRYMSDRIEGLLKKDPWFRQLEPRAQRNGLRLVAQWTLNPQQGAPKILDNKSQPVLAEAIAALKVRNAVEPLANGFSPIEPVSSHASPETTALMTQLRDLDPETFGKLPDAELKPLADGILEMKAKGAIPGIAPDATLTVEALQSAALHVAQDPTFRAGLEGNGARDVAARTVESAKVPEATKGRFARLGEVMGRLRFWGERVER